VWKRFIKTSDFTYKYRISAIFHVLFGGGGMCVEGREGADSRYHATTIRLEVQVTRKCYENSDFIAVALWLTPLKQAWAPKTPEKILEYKH